MSTTVACLFFFALVAREAEINLVVCSLEIEKPVVVQIDYSSVCAMLYFQYFHSGRFISSRSFLLVVRGTGLGLCVRTNNGRCELGTSSSLRAISGNCRIQSFMHPARIFALTSKVVKRNHNGMNINFAVAWIGFVREFYARERNGLPVTTERTARTLAYLLLERRCTRSTINTGRRKKKTFCMRYPEHRNVSRMIELVVNCGLIN